MPQIDDHTLTNHRLHSAAATLAGYASTCRLENLHQWLEGLAGRINETLTALGDDDRVEVVKDKIQRVKSR
jgi:hypothetical protein